MAQMTVSMCNGDLGQKFTANGWHVLYVDGHDVEQIANALDAADQHDKPVAIIAETIKGKGVSFHGEPSGLAWQGS